jgi:hypothetical protein
MRTLPLLLASSALLLGAAFLGFAGSDAGARPTRSDAVPNSPDLAAVHELQFVANVGQWDAAVRFAAVGDTAAWLHDDGFTLRFERWSAAASDAVGAGARVRTQRGAIVRTRFLAAATSDVIAEQPLATQYHFFVGEPQRWRQGVPACRAVRLQHVQPGIDVRFRALPCGGSLPGGNGSLPAGNGPFEYDLLLAPGADLARFAARCEGVERLAIDADGRLCATVATDDGVVELVQQAPIAWQESPDGPRPLRVQFRLLDDHTYGFVADELDPALAAVVDPGVVWGTFLGGGQTDRVNAMRWVPGNGVYVAGWAGSLDFPTTVGAYRTTGGADGFVARLSDDGQALQFATYLGGSASEEIRGLDLGAGNSPIVVGFTTSTNFPATPGALQTSYGGAGPFLAIGDGFAARLDANGSALGFSTYLGGVFDDVAEAVRVDAAGNPVVVGWTASPNFPSTPGVFQPALAGFAGITSDGFVTRLSANGQSVSFSTFLGGSISEQLLAVDRDPTTGDWLVAGWTLSNDLPVTFGAFRSSITGAYDGMAARLSPNGTGATFVTYAGGLLDDALLSVRGAADGTVWLGGFTASTNFPLTPNAVQNAFGGETEGVVMRLAANGQSLLYSTFLGGTGPDRVRAVALSTLGVLAVGDAGANFPVTLDAPQTQFAGGVTDAFATLLTNNGATRTWSSYFGGVGQDAFGSAWMTDGGLAVVGGWTYSADFPIEPSAYDDVMNGTEDGLVMKFDLVSTLGAGLQVASATAQPLQIVPAGEQTLLDTTVTNTTARELRLDTLRVLAAGAGDTANAVAGVRVFGTVAGQLRTLLSGPVTLVGDDREHVLSLGGQLVPAGASLRLEVVADLVVDAAGRTVEVGLAVCDEDAWGISAPGAGSGPTVRVAGTGRVDGTLFVVGALPGDADGDGAITAVDLRRRLATLGGNDLQADVDGDGVTTTNDVALLREVLLGRATLLQAPTQVARGTWVTLRGALVAGSSVQASLGGRSLTVGRVTAREITLRVEADQVLGTQDLLVTIGGRPFASAFVQVQ